MYYTNINDYEQLLNTSEVQSPDMGITTIIVIALIATFLLLI